MSEEILNEILRNANRDDLFRQIVVRAYRTGTMIQVYANPVDLSGGYEGYVLEVGDDAFAMQELDDEGELEGVITLTFRSVMEICERSRLLCRLQALRDAQKRAEYESGEEGEEYSQSDLIRGRLERARVRGDLVNVRISTPSDFRFVAGFVRSMNKEFAQFNALTESGNPDGIATVRMQDITAVFEDDWQIRRALLLHQSRENLYDEAESDAYEAPGE